ncbi:MAG: hypothetical protein WAU70_16760 [Flavobacteriales bacterium]
MSLIRIAPAAVLAASIALEARAQCNLTSAGANWQFGCTSGVYANLYQSAAWNGGTPPFTVQWPFGPPSNVFSNSANSTANFPGPPNVLNPPWAYSVLVTDAMQCQLSIPFAQAAAHFTFEVLQVSLAATDCPAGVFTATFPDGGGPMYTVLNNDLSCINYTLQKNGTTVQTGTLNTVLLQNPLRLSFPGLTNGNFDLVLQQTGFCNNTTYCPSLTVRSFYVPGPNDCSAVYLRTALQGALPSGSTLMNDALRSSGLLPLTEPYSALGYAYTGSAPGATVPASYFNTTGNLAIVDWVVVELRSSTAPHAVVHSKAALLRRDGVVIDTDGDAHVSFPQSGGSYRVAVRHRNHLGVMTGSAVVTSPNPVIVNFQSSSTSTYGTNARFLSGSVWCQWSGDVTGNGTIAYTGTDNDRDPILTAIGGTLPTTTLAWQYRQEDVNMDGVVKYVGANNDRDPILQNVGGTTPTSTRVQQLP